MHLIAGKYKVAYGEMFMSQLDLNENKQGQCALPVQCTLPVHYLDNVHYLYNVQRCIKPEGKCRHSHGIRSSCWLNVRTSRGWKTILRKMTWV